MQRGPGSWHVAALRLWKIPDAREFKANLSRHFSQIQLWLILSTMESLERLKGLHEDLVAFTTTRLANIDRLWQELEASVQDFRQLLDAPAQDTIKTDSLGSSMSPHVPL